MLLYELAHLLHERIYARAFFERGGRAAHEGRESPIVIFDAHGCGALAPLDHDLDLAVLLLLRLQDSA